MSFAPDGMDLTIKYGPGYSYGGGNFGVDSAKGKELGNLIFPSNWDNPVLPRTFIRGLRFKNEFVVPDCVTEIGPNFNYCGDCPSIVIGKNVQTMNTYAFGGNMYSFLSLKEMTFLGETPPSMQNNSVPRFTPDLKVYVPDNSIEEYTNLLTSISSNFIVLPISQKS